MSTSARLSVDLDRQVHLALRHAALDADTDVSTIVRSLVDDYLLRCRIATREHWIDNPPTSLVALQEMVDRAAEIPLPSGATLPNRPGLPTAPPNRGA